MSMALDDEEEIEEVGDLDEDFEDEEGGDESDE